MPREEFLVELGQFAREDDPGVRIELAEIFAGMAHLPGTHVVGDRALFVAYSLELAFALARFAG